MRKNKEKLIHFLIKMRAFTTALNMRSKEPTRYKEVNSILEQMRTGVIVYSATNSFGGRIQSSFNCSQ